MEKSLYDQIGGEAALKAAVEIFYRKVLADKRINRFFAGVDMNWQNVKLKAFLTMALGGPNRYTGRDLRAGHAHLVRQGLNDAHVDAVIENLGATLKELGVPEVLIGRVAGIADSVRDDVLGRAAPPLPLNPPVPRAAP
jgi:hemoglobin